MSDTVKRTRKPPRLVARALLATFLTVALILLAVVVLISLDVRQRARQSVAGNLDAGQQAFAVVEALRQRDLSATVSTLAENPTLKAALDTWQTGRRDAGAASGDQVHTVQRQADKVAALVGADVLAFLDVDGRIVASAGPRASAWAPGTRLRTQMGGAAAGGEFIAQVPDGVFRVTGVPLLLGDALIGSLELGSALDVTDARELATLARGDSAIIIDRRVLATTLPATSAADLAAALPLVARSAVVELGGESYAVRQVHERGPATFLALASIDAAVMAGTRAALTSGAWIGAAALALAALGSWWLARTLTSPIDRLSASVSSMTRARSFDTVVPPTGTSRELDDLADTFNALIRAVAEAEAETQAAYLGAIRALAATLDARDPYTAGHSERVSALSVEMGRVMSLGDHDLDTLRLGALLHDIGKIGVPDEVLGKTSMLTPAEFELIRAHPVIGARILRSIPFLAEHLPIVELHHERVDGKGYPYGLSGDAIPPLARIVHVADAYDAITTARAYRSGRQPKEALGELHRCAGTDFDPACVHALMAALPKLPAASTSFDPAVFHIAKFTRPHA